MGTGGRHTELGVQTKSQGEDPYATMSPRMKRSKRNSFAQEQQASNFETIKPFCGGEVK